jgi:hypothetical protein
MQPEVINTNKNVTRMTITPLTGSIGNSTDCCQSAIDLTSHASKLFEHAASSMGWNDKLSAGKNSLTSSLGLLYCAVIVYLK